MTHPRQRSVLPRFQHALKWSPSVGILGMRQVGKTTLMRGLSSSFFTFDDPSSVADFEQRGKALLESAASPVGLDEVQKAPVVFDLVKLLSDAGKRKGRFILTGSARFSSKKQIRESLTGRIALIDLFPLSLAECHSHEPSNFLERISKTGVSGAKGAEKACRDLEKRHWATSQQIEAYLGSGGLPGICFRRDPIVRDELFKNHLDTLLGRDLGFVLRSNLSISQLGSLFALIAQNQGLPVNYSALAREAGATGPTIKATLRAFEAIFLVRSHGRTYFVEDQGLAAYAAGTGVLMRRKLLGGYLYHELRCQVSYATGFQARLGEVNKRGGVFIPFLVQPKNGSPIALTFDADTAPSDKSLKSLSWYRKTAPDTAAIAVHLGQTGFVASSGTLCLPLSWIV